MKLFRYLVSQNKNRTIDSTIPGGTVDLDLTEIYPRVVCMGFPASGFESLYRNSYNDELRYLDHKYGENYMVYNLCKEPSYTYPLDRFHGRVRCYPFYDHHPAPLEMMPAFVKDACSYLNEDSRNVVVIHCMAGKGRTGIMACCLLLRIDPSMHQSAQEAIKYYGEKRTKDGDGLTPPNQRRSVQYYEYLLQRFGGEVPSTIPVLQILEIRFVDLSQVSLHHITIVHESTNQQQTLKLKDMKSGKSPARFQRITRSIEGVKEVDVKVIDCRASAIQFCGDLKIYFYSRYKRVGFLYLHSLFVKAFYGCAEIDYLNHITSPYSGVEIQVGAADGDAGPSSDASYPS